MAKKCKISNVVCLPSACPVQPTLLEIVKREQQESSAILERILSGGLSGGYRQIEEKVFALLEERLNRAVQSSMGYISGHLNNNLPKEELLRTLRGKAYEEFMYIAVLLMKKLKKVIGEPTTLYSKLHRLLASDKSAIISPSGSLELYTALYPGKEQVEHPFGASIKGVSVPDGIIITADKNPAILGLLEYTHLKNYGKDNYLRKKYNGFATIVEECASLFRNPSLIFIGTGNKAAPDFALNEKSPYIDKGAINRSALELINMPLQNDILNKIVERLYNSILQYFNKNNIGYACNI